MNLIQSVSFVSSTTESLRIPSHVLEAAHYFKEYCYEEIHFIIICHHWTLKIGISWRFTEHFAAVFSACRVSTQLPGVHTLHLQLQVPSGAVVTTEALFYVRSSSEPRVPAVLGHCAGMSGCHANHWSHGHHAVR